MAIMAKNEGDRPSFEPAPEGVFQAVCVDVIDLGILSTVWQGVTKAKHKVTFAWQIDALRDDGKPYMVFKRYTKSLHERSALSKDLASWRGKKITKAEERDGINLEEFIGMNCLVNIVHAEVGDRIYANVTSVNPTMRTMKPLKAQDYTRKKDRETPETPALYDDRNPPPDAGDDDGYGHAV